MAINAHILYGVRPHKNYLLNGWNFEQRLAIHANQHLIIHGDVGIILDPGGRKIFSKAFSETSACLQGGKLKYIFLSHHQDPDVVAALNGWLMMTDAVGYTFNTKFRKLICSGFDLSNFLGICRIFTQCFFVYMMYIFKELPPHILIVLFIHRALKVIASNKEFEHETFTA